MPLVSSYIDALSLSHLSLSTLSTIEFERDNDGNIMRYEGSRGVVIKGLHNARLCGMKLFTNPQPEVLDRYRYISDRRLGFTSRYEVFNDEILLFNTQKPFPLLLFDWLDGVTLATRLEYLCRLAHRDELAILRDKVIDLFIELLESGIIHSDLKPDNILCCDSGELKIIDWDCCYHRDMGAVTSTEIGSDGYCREYRTVGHYGMRLDDYPIALIVMNMIILTEHPNLLFRGTNGCRDMYEIFSVRGVMNNFVRDKWRYMPSHKALIDYILSDELGLDSLLDILCTLRGRSSYSEEHYSVVDDSGDYRRVVDKRSRLYGYIDTKRNLVTIDTIYGDATRFSSEVAAVKLNNSWFFINTKGERVSEEFYSVIEKRDGLFAVKRSIESDYEDINFKINYKDEKLF